jgi:hypothetical protein
MCGVELHGNVKWLHRIYIYIFQQLKNSIKQETKLNLLTGFSPKCPALVDYGKILGLWSGQQYQGGGVGGTLVPDLGR